MIGSCSCSPPSSTSCSKGDIILQRNGLKNISFEQNIVDKRSKIDHLSNIFFFLLCSAQNTLPHFKQDILPACLSCGPRSCPSRGTWTCTVMLKPVLFISTVLYTCRRGCACSSSLGSGSGSCSWTGASCGGSCSGSCSCPALLLLPCPRPCLRCSSRPDQG